MSVDTETAATPSSAPAKAPVSDSMRRWTLALWDLREGLRRWELWWLLGMNDIRQRYRRSRLGQFWITLSMSVTIGGIGVVYAFLFNMSLRDYLPYLAVNMIVWVFISGILVDSGMTFMQAENFLRQERLPKTTFVMRLLVRNSLILAHNAVLIPIVFVAFGVSVSWEALLAIPGFVIVFLNGFFVAIVLGIICSRFRDLQQIIVNVTQVAFFVSPIMWQRQQLPQQHGYIVDLNPIAAHLAVVAEPLLGRVPSLLQYLTCLATTLVLALIVLPFFARYRERVIYWL